MMQNAIDLAELNVADFYTLLEDLLYEILQEQSGSLDDEIGAEVAGYMETFFVHGEPLRASMLEEINAQ